MEQGKDHQDETHEEETEEEEEQATVTEKENEENSKHQPQCSLRGKNIRLMIYTSKWPKKTLTKYRLIKGIEEEKYKYVYKDELLEKREILELIENYKIDLEECFALTEDRVFRKIRPVKE